MVLVLSSYGGHENFRVSIHLTFRCDRHKGVIVAGYEGMTARGFLPTLPKRPRLVQPTQFIQVLPRLLRIPQQCICGRCEKI